MSINGLFAADGCVNPNIATRPYAISFAPKCEHAKVRGAIIVIEAEDQDAALIFAQKWLMTGPLRGQTVITGICRADQDSPEWALKA